MNTHTQPALLEELVRFVKTAGTNLPLGNLPEAEIRHYLAHHAQHGTLSWCRVSPVGKELQTFGLLCVWPVAEEWLRWCPDQPVVGAWPDWTADSLYIGEVIVTGGATSQARQLEVLMRSLATRHPEGMRKRWWAHRSLREGHPELVSLEHWKVRAEI